jgi:tetratricopeptide (TPR) repeat protein
MLLAILMLQLALPLPPATGQDARARFSECIDLAAADPAKGEAAALKWHSEGGGYLAHQCRGVALTNQDKWPATAGTFEEAAREADAAGPGRSADFWAQAGNAWLVAGDTERARAALDTAIDSGSLLGAALGQAHLDRGRVRVAAGDLEGARSDLDRATTHAADDPIAWLLSATLARRMTDLIRADKDIKEALRRSPEDASIQLEAGNIAALRDDVTGARAAWSRVIELVPGSPQANAARKGLDQFGAAR